MLNVRYILKGFYFLLSNISTQTWLIEVLFSMKYKWMVTTAIQKRFQWFSANDLIEFLTQRFGHILLWCFYGAFFVLFAPGPHYLHYMEAAQTFC